MIDPNNVPDFEVDEVVARFILAGQSKKSLRKLVRADETIKPLLFLPYDHIELSVNRHRDCTENEIWGFGEGVAGYRNLVLHGRSDIHVEDCKFDTLEVLAKPIQNDPNGVPDNPNHADIVGFPAKKEDQLSLAGKLAAKATDRLLPP